MAAKKTPAPQSDAGTAPPGTNYRVLRDRELIEAADAYYDAQNEIARLEAEQKSRKERLVRAMEGAPVAYAGNRILTVTVVPETPATPNVTITAAMVGRVIPGRKGRAGSTRLQVT